MGIQRWDIVLVQDHPHKEEVIVRNATQADIDAWFTILRASTWPGFGVNVFVAYRPVETKMSPEMSAFLERLQNNPDFQAMLKRLADA